MNDNTIDPDSFLAYNVVLGMRNYIAPDVSITGADVEIGDDNRIAENVRIICPKFRMGNECKLHNHVFIDGDEVGIGNNVWVGQYTHLDGKGTLVIGDDVTIGYNCCVWTHADRAGLPDFHKAWIKPPRPTVLERGVWLMGANVQVNPGVTMGEFSIALNNSVVTRDVPPRYMVAGNPARIIRYWNGKGWRSV